MVGNVVGIEGDIVGMVIVIVIGMEREMEERVEVMVRIW